MKKISKYNKIISANWKMNGSLNLIKAYEKYLLNKKNSIKNNKALIICPPYPFIHFINNICRKLENIYTGSQDCSIELDNSRTGEVSASIIKNIGSDFIILGHSERRLIKKESNKTISKKVEIALNNNLIPIVCVGETIFEKNKLKTKHVIKKQIENSLTTSCNPENTIIAYEPVWAIGSGKIPSIGETEFIHEFIHKILISKFKLKKDSKKFKILYGGSVKSTNSKEFLNSKLIDGVLLGGSSLNIKELHKIINFDRN